MAIHDGIKTLRESAPESESPHSFPKLEDGWENNCAPGNDRNGYDESLSNTTLPNHGIKKVLVVLHSYVKATLEKGEDGYKGTERSAVYILKELHRRGIEAHLIAPAGSNIPGVILHPSTDKTLWDFSDPKNPQTASPETIAKVMDRTIELMNEVVAQEKPDIVDCNIAHNEKLDKALERLPVPHVVNFHGPTKDKPDLQTIVAKHPILPVITVSKLQQKFLKANYVGAVPNGLPEDVITYRPGQKKNELVMLARLSPKKDFPRGIEIAKQANMKLIIGGTLLNDQSDRIYYEEVLVPLFEREKETVTLREDICEANKADFLSDKVAPLALTKREADRFGPEYIEADGMHITEALAAGVPVICDSGVDPSKVPPEVGFRCDSIEEAVEALRKTDMIDPEACNRYFLENFTVNKTVERRLAVYAKVIGAFCASLSA
ncbi:hypothetical protein F5X99DRAFT_423802 [Biscogniauxia marginata]|nr:hypothetical protein F5X99DRAFT_423802 [Biscogniauxia marginata]